MRGALTPGEDVIQPGPDLPVVVKAEDLCLGELVGELAPVALGQAADGGDLGTGPGGGEQLVDRLLLGRVDEATGVDEDDVRVFPFAPQRPAARRKTRGELF